MQVLNCPNCSWKRHIDESTEIDDRGTTIAETEHTPKSKAKAMQKDPKTTCGGCGHESLGVSEA